MNEKIEVPTPASKPKKWPLYVAIGVVAVFVMLYVGTMFVGRLVTNQGFGSLEALDGTSSGWIPDSTADYDYGNSVDAQKAANVMEEYASDDTTVPTTSGAAPTDTKDRMIIKTATISSEVEDLDDAGDEAKKIAKMLDGYVIGFTKYDDTAYSSESLTVTVRVPVENFDELVEEFEDLGKVTYQNSNGDDVTDQYIDLESKLKNLEASEKQYMEIMKMATKVTEVLEVQRELTNIRSQIEVLKGQMQYYEKSADLSTVSITFSLKTSAQEVIDDKWDPNGTVRNALRALTDTFQAVADAVIYGFILSPIIIVPGLVGWMIVKIVRRVRIKTSK